MTDSVTVFSPGFRVTDSLTGAPLSGAVIRFYDAGTDTPKTVYSDEGLTTSLGTSVTTDSLGYPTSDGSTKALVYVGTASYKVTIETSAAVVIATHDNVKGAVESADPGNVSVTSTRPVSTKSLNYTVLEADQNTAFVSNCSGGDVTFTLPSAATVGNGWLCSIQHAGSSNQTIIATVSSQTITSGALNYGGTLSLSNSGEEVWLISDGGNWRVVAHVGPHIKRGQAIITVADRLAAAPGSPPEAGVLYIATGAATWGSTSVANHDVVLHTSGGAYVKITPPTDCGWVAFVQDEDENYQFIGSAWVQLITRPASQSDQETGTSALKAVTPSVQHNHPSAAKFWAYVTVSGGTPTLAANYNVTSITDSGVGLLTVTIATDFSSANWCSVTSVGSAGSGTTHFVISKAAGSIQIDLRSYDGSGFPRADPTDYSIAGFGDQ